jgi:hypothetical protein
VTVTAGTEQLAEGFTGKQLVITIDISHEPNALSVT